jgi:hypothetical protein
MQIPWKVPTFHQNYHIQSEECLKINCQFDDSFENVWEIHE